MSKKGWEGQRLVKIALLRLAILSMRSFGDKVEEKERTKAAALVTYYNERQTQSELTK